MQAKSVFLFLMVSLFCLPLQKGWTENEEDFTLDENTLYINALASLTFHVLELKEGFNASCNSEDDQEPIVFSKDDIYLLLDRVGSTINCSSDDQEIAQKTLLFAKACDYYTKADEAAQKGDRAAAKKFIKKTHRLFKKLWHQALDEAYPDTASIDFELFDEEALLLRQKTDPFKLAFHIPAYAKKKMHPYLIPETHPMKKPLDRIFTKTRVTLDEKSFHSNGFHTLALGPRSYVRVARHKNLPKHLVKVQLDNEVRRKNHHDSWEWFVKRCEGAKKLREVIQRKNVKYFTVPDKYIYPLPSEPAPPKSSHYVRQLCLVLVTDMNLESEERNLHAWKHSITKQHLRELYYCISNAKGSSYRPDNIALTKSKQFAFIDTEYPHADPDFRRIRHYLNSKMRLYWDELVQSGGHPSASHRPRRR